MAITNVPSSITDPQLRQFLAQVKETLEVVTGQRRGNPLDTPVSLRQLLNYGLVQPSGGGYTAPGTEYDPMQDYSVPDAPSGVFVIGSMNYIQLEWAGSGQRNVSHTEIWRAPVDDQAQSVLIGTGYAVYADPVGPSSEFYYWLRFISYTGVPSPWHDLSGAHGQTADDPAQLLAILSERITESELYADLNSRINLIDEPGIGLVDSLSQEIATRQSEITQLQTTVNGNTAAVQTQATSINGLEAKYTVKVDNNGRVAGYGLASTTNSYDGSVHSTMLFSVDTFAVGAPGATTLSFVIENGKVVMDGAAIKNASINTAQVGAIAVDRISGVNSSFLLSRIGTGNITNAYIGQVIQSNNYVPGSSGWRIDKSGTAEFRSGYFRGDIYSANAYVRGDVEASSIKAGSANIIDTLMLQGQSVTLEQTYYSSSSITLSTTGYTSVASRSIPMSNATSQSAINVTGVFQIDLEGFKNGGFQPNYLSLNVQILRGSTVVHTRTVHLTATTDLQDGDWTIYARSIVPIQWTEAPGPGTFTYTIQMWFNDSYATAGSASYRSLIVRGGKR